MTGKGRNSNLELLRILAMLMIIAFHIYYHCVYVQLSDKTSIALFDNGLFCHPAFYKRLLMLFTFAPLGKIGNAVFLLISGYFSCAKVSESHLTKIVKKLMTQQIFAVIFLIFASTLLFRFSQAANEKMGISITRITMIDANFFNKDMSWFIGYYFLVVLIADLCMNQYLAKLTQAGYTRFILILFALTQFEWAAELLKNLSTGLKTLTAGVFLFALGGYIRKFDPFRRLRSFTIGLIMILCYLLVYLTYYNVTENKIQTYLEKGSTSTFIQTMPKYADSYLIPIVLGICLFELFRRLPERRNPVINYLGSATLMIYLIHDNKFFYSLWNTRDWITLLYYHPVKYLGVHLVWVLVTFLLGLYAYLLYQLFAVIGRDLGKVFLKEDVTKETK